MTPGSRTEAHRVFADLYRKSRTPEHQQLIDEAILRTNDVFLRIDLINHADEDYLSKTKTQDKSKSQAEENEGSRSDFKFKQEQKPKRPSEPVPPDPIKQKQAATKKDTETKQGGGLFAGLFGGGGQNPIAKFGKETGTLDTGLFGRNPTISQSSERLFRTLKEDVIIPTILALKLAEQQGWRSWTPLVYNIINNFNKFLNALVSLDALFLDKISPEVFLDRSIKMQMFYVRFLQREDSARTILEFLPALVNLDPKMSTKLSNIMNGVNFGLNLENVTPKLSDTITAFHIVSKKKMCNWNDIVKDLKVPPIQENKFQASREIQKEVDFTIAKVSDRINMLTFKKMELQILRTRYFTIDENGKINFDFLNGVVDDFATQHIPAADKSQTVKNTYKSMPHKLLYLLFRDIQAVYMNILEGYVKIGDHNQNRDVLIVQPGLFRPEIEKMNLIIRTLDSFNKKFPSFQYSFKAFNGDINKEATDQITNTILAALNESAEFFGSFANRLNTIVDSHLMAKESDSKGKTNEYLAQSKEKVIEEIKLQKRYIPHYDKVLVMKGRINGQTVEGVLIQLTRYLYNYAVIFKDNRTTQKLTMHRKIEQELASLHKEYERLTFSTFNQEAYQETHPPTDEASSSEDEPAESVN